MTAATKQTIENEATCAYRMGTHIPRGFGGKMKTVLDAGLKNGWHLWCYDRSPTGDEIVSGKWCAAHLESGEMVVGPIREIESGKIEIHLEDEAQWYAGLDQVRPISAISQAYI